MPPGQEVVYHGNGIKAKWEFSWSAIRHIAKMPEIS